MGLFNRLDDDYYDDDNVIDLGKKKGKNNKKISMIIPKGMDDSKDIADGLLDGYPVIIKLTDVDDKTAQRIMDFCSGVCYALDGSLRKVTPKILIAAPQNTNLEGVFEE